MAHSLADGYLNKSTIYDSARPSYPTQAIEFIHRQLDLSCGLPVLDVGSGTGILTRQLASTGMPVIGVEPDAQMLATARMNTAATSAAFRCGTAERLGFAADSVSALVCGQSFHWFDPGKTQSEFRRVLATNNPVFLVWNIRSPDCDEFHHAYEQLLCDQFERYEETLQIDQCLEDRIRKFFQGSIQECTFLNSQQLSEPGLLERTMSCSYAMQPGTAEYMSAICALSALYQQYGQKEGVSLNYRTRVVYGNI
ncbi:MULTISPECIES: class I SAM-dependent methyltransferase [Pseudomonas]|uniref:class I SAM-dependent methyltransferase n=1 Tax=Pseudomonas TaxID=286 RepID=UPI001BE9BDB0|nr:MULTISPECIES: class I SAM-dependent methyltransferase [Pseudomonas]MBT2340713.1 class I SAM-dependent methyltransferase [Pseudomonas fluorescens]MCD4528853.1 class I SAM-dependent methyltransferase [Pseudomonas sp. C3-2018]